MKFRTALLAAATAMAVPAAASAQVVEGFYVGALGGFNYLQDFDARVNTAVGSLGTNFQPNGGGVGIINVGYGFGGSIAGGVLGGLRIELEGNYRYNDGDGTIQQYGAMANLLFNIDFGIGIVPYVGGGVGYGVANIDSSNRTVGTGTNAVTGKLDDSQGGFAYQAIVGLAFPLDTVVPGLALTAEYRFYSIVGLDDYDTKASRGGTFKSSVDDMYNHSGLLGLRYAFNAPAPPPPPAPVAQQQVARTFLVFFDFDRSNLTDRARAVVAEAANAARTTGTTRIEVSGHADTVGSAAYNQALSMRRAESVATELEARGISRSQMVLQAFGFTRLLVPTGPGVREPQNRRVEIVLR
jgi:OOP family OmpA-OmpF porin